jgi:hypothetical protein
MQHAYTAQFTFPASLIVFQTFRDFTPCTLRDFYFCRQIFYFANKFTAEY